MYWTDSPNMATNSSIAEQTLLDPVFFVTSGLLDMLGRFKSHKNQNTKTENINNQKGTKNHLSKFEWYIFCFV